MIEIEIEVERPLREVYAAFNHPDNLPRWIQGLQRTEVISGEPGQIGAKTRQIYLERGRIVEMVETITAHEPERYMAGILDGQGFQATMEVNFIDRGERTGIHFRTNFQGQSILMRLMLPFIKGPMRKRSCGDLESFKRLVEAGELHG